MSISTEERIGKLEARVSALLETIGKFNPYHDSRGRFSSGGAGGRGASALGSAVRSGSRLKTSPLTISPAEAKHTVAAKRGIDKVGTHLGHIERAYKSAPNVQRQVKLARKRLDGIKSAVHDGKWSDAKRRIGPLRNILAKIPTA